MSPERQDLWLRSAISPLDRRIVGASDHGHRLYTADSATGRKLLAAFGETWGRKTGSLVAGDPHGGPAAWVPHYRTSRDDYLCFTVGAKVLRIVNAKVMSIVKYFNSPDAACIEGQRFGIANIISTAPNPSGKGSGYGT